MAAAVLELTAQAYSRAIDASSALDLLVCGCVGTLMTVTWAYRVLTRRFDWGPSDT